MTKRKRDHEGVYPGIVLRDTLTKLYHRIIFRDNMTETESYHRNILWDYITESYYEIILRNYIMELYHRIILRNHITE